MNPRIPADYAEVGRWLAEFATSHAKRENVRVEVHVDMTGPREGRSYGLRLALGARTAPAAELPALEFAYGEVREGRTRFAWCAALAERVQAVAREFSAGVGDADSRSA